jgi:hypothetical protein
MFSPEKLPILTPLHTSLQCPASVMLCKVPFIPFRPLAQAALPDSQNTANVTVKKKSCRLKKKLREFYKYIVCPQSPLGVLKNCGAQTN